MLLRCPEGFRRDIGNNCCEKTLLTDLEKQPCFSYHPHFRDFFIRVLGRWWRNPCRRTSGHGSSPQWGRWERGQRPSRPNLATFKRYRWGKRNVVSFHFTELKKSRKWRFFPNHRGSGKRWIDSIEFGWKRKHHECSQLTEYLKTVWKFRCR